MGMCERVSEKIVLRRNHIHLHLIKAQQAQRQACSEECEEV